MPKAHGDPQRGKVLLSLKLKTCDPRLRYLERQRTGTSIKRTVIYHIFDNTASDGVTTQGPDLSFQAYIWAWQEECVCPVVLSCWWSSASHRSSPLLFLAASSKSSWFFIFISVLSGNKNKPKAQVSDSVEQHEGSQLWSDHTSLWPSRTQRELKRK